MDVTKTLRDLYAEKRRLDTAIAALEEHLRGLSTAGPGRRGRKKMDPEERLKVSRRMSEYWEARRGQTQTNEAEPTEPADGSTNAG